MQETIKFELSSRMAIIRKPESNETYYTYTFPHKIMLYGILGSIIGLNGYNFYSLQKFLGKDVERMPEFYTKLENLKIGVVPHIKYKNFSKKIQSFNNSVGYASKEAGNNWVVKEQWLENPKWDIYLLDNDSDEYKKIKDYLLNSKCEYIPYIGKNDHFASIKNIEIIEAQKAEDVERIDSIFAEEILASYVDSFMEMVAFGSSTGKEFKYKEVLPTKLNEKIGYQDFKQFIYTNKKLNLLNRENLYLVKEKTIYYF